MSDVLVVLVNYARPANLPAAIAAWRAQTVAPSRLVVVDNSPGAGTEPYPNPAFAGADDVWRWRANAGCPCRWAPALLDCAAGHVLFADDDLLPGTQAMEYALAAAEALGGRFATLGVSGRLFQLDRPPGRRYSGRSGPSRTHADPAPCHATCRVSLVRRASVRHAVDFRERLLARFGAEAVPLVGVHDDLLLSLGVQAAEGVPSYVLPTESDPEQRLILRDLDDGEAAWRRPGHFEARCRLVDMALEIGWRPLA